MFDTEESVTIHAISNNDRKGTRPRKPLVQVLCATDWGVESMCFHPDDARAVARAINAAAKAAKAGRRLKETEIKLKRYL